MSFVITPSPTEAPHRQIVEQVKVGLLTGTLRPGDMLPSIRDLKRDLKITEAVVRRAYAELARQGLVTLLHGKGVRVSPGLNYDAALVVAEQYEVAVQQAVTRAQKDGLLLSCFARLVAQRARELEAASPPLVYVDATAASAGERAAVISRAWGVHVEGVALARLGALLRSVHRPLKILTNYYRHSEVLEAVKRTGLPVIPMGLSYSAAMVARVEALPRGAAVLLVVDPADAGRADRMIDDYRQRFGGRDVRFEVRAARTEGQIVRCSRGRAFALILVSARLWDGLAPATRALDRVMRTDMEFTPAQLEAARVAAGVIV